MGEEVREVQGMDEEGLLRAAALDRLIRDIIPDVGPSEFTCADASVRWGWTESQARRALGAMVKDGKLMQGTRYDPRVRRRVVAYWFVD